MAKKIKFPLKLKNDFPVRTLEELKEHFDLEKMVGYFLDGKLLRWLQARYYENEADSVKKLSKDDTDLNKNLCDIFGVEYQSKNSTDIDSIEKFNKRLTLLRQYTSDTEILGKVTQIAFTQKEFDVLLDEDIHNIYLCNNSFSIPLSIKDKHCIGIGNVEIIVRSDKYINFEDKNVVFDNVHFDSEYEAIRSRSENLFLQGNRAQSDKQFKQALDFFSQSADLGNTRAMLAIAYIYYTGNEQIAKNYSKAVEWWSKAADYGSYSAMINLSKIYYKGVGVVLDQKKAVEFYLKAVESGFLIIPED